MSCPSFVGNLRLIPGACWPKTSLCRMMHDLGDQVKEQQLEFPSTSQWDPPARSGRSPPLLQQRDSAPFGPSWVSWARPTRHDLSHPAHVGEVMATLQAVVGRDGPYCVLAPSCSPYQRNSPRNPFLITAKFRSQFPAGGTAMNSRDLRGPHCTLRMRQYLRSPQDYGRAGV